MQICVWWKPGISGLRAPIIPMKTHMLLKDEANRAAGEPSFDGADVGAGRLIMRCAARQYHLWVLVASTIAVCLLPANRLAADGVVRDGLGAISSARGGANIGHNDNGEILLDNPAAMVNIPGCGLAELSGDLLFKNIRYDDPQNSARSIRRPIGLPQISIIRKSADQRWAYGLGLYAPAGFSVEFDLADPPLLPPATYRYKSFAALAKIIPGVAYRLTDTLSVGGTIGVGVGHAELDGPFYLQTGPLRGTPMLLDLEATGATLVWSVGIQHILNDATTWGIRFESESRLNLDGNARLVGIPQRFDSQVEIAWPRSLGVGVKHSLCDHHRVSADAIWYNWNDAFDTIDIAMSNEMMSVSDSFPLHWRDSLSVRLGYEWLPDNEHVLRAGYVYHTSTVPDATLTPFIPATLEHAFSIGTGRQWGASRLDIAYQFSFAPARRVGTSDIIGGDFDQSRVQAQAHWIYVSLLREF